MGSHRGASERIGFSLLIFLAFKVIFEPGQGVEAQKSLTVKAILRHFERGSVLGTRVLKNEGS